MGNKTADKATAPRVAPRAADKAAASIRVRAADKYVYPLSEGFRIKHLVKFC